MDSGGGASSSLGGLAKDLIKAMVIGWLGTQYPLLYDLLVLLTIIEPPDNAQPTATLTNNGAFRRMPVFFPELHFERLSPLLSSPGTVLRTAYVNELATVDDANAMADVLFTRLANILTDLSIPHAYGDQRQRKRVARRGSNARRPLFVDLPAITRGRGSRRRRCDAGALVADRGDSGSGRNAVRRGFIYRAVGQLDDHLEPYRGHFGVRLRQARRDDRRERRRRRSRCVVHGGARGARQRAGIRVRVERRI